MTRLVIFDIDGTLTDTYGVDDECYREAVAEALGLTADTIDWKQSPHITDSGIFHWLCTVHGHDVPTADDVGRARRMFVDRLTAALDADPTRFRAIAGAPDAVAALEGDGWGVAFATGGWGVSARLKLRVARIPVREEVLACADDAMTRADIVQCAIARAERHYGCTFERVVSVGDGPWDVKTAAALGLSFIGIGTGDAADRLRQLGASTILGDYTDAGAFADALVSATVPLRL
jgi:phosphoglycolate phosphatase-like HAD superfamily hydrolase